MAEQSEVGDVAKQSRESAIGDGNRQDMDHGILTGFGEFRARTLFETGCRPADVITGNGVVMFQMKEIGGNVTTVTIGNTPEDFDEWDLDAETRREMGEPGKYLLHKTSKRTDTNNPDTPPQTSESYHFLDDADLEGVAVRKGSKVTVFAPNLQRQRALSFPGEVQDVLALN